MPVVTGCIIAVNVAVFLLELTRGDAFVTQWSAIPAQITSGHNLITILTAMFMHGSWSHIIGNMIFLWAFAPEIEDAMGPVRYLIFIWQVGLSPCWRRSPLLLIPRCRIWERAVRSRR
jgi:membrane associated rhomboid family serine protease